MERRTRQELGEIHKELQELLAASKPSGSNQSLACAPASPGTGDDSTRRSGERAARKGSAELIRKLSGSDHLGSGELPPVPQEQEEEEQQQQQKSTGDGKAVAAAAGAGSYSLGASWMAPPLLAGGGKHGAGGARPGQQRGGCAGRLPWVSFRAVGVALRRHPSIWVLSLLVTLLLMAASIAGVLVTAAYEIQQRRQAAEGFAINAAVAFERQLQQMFAPLLTLATIIRYQPEYSVINRTFDSVAAELLAQMPTQGAVTTLIAAPQGVLRNIYPMEGYCRDACSNVHMDLFRNPERRAVALRTVEDGVLTMQGPMILSQGYYGVVGRQPVYVSPAAPNETWGAPGGPAYDCAPCFNATTRTRFWGFVNAVINFDPLINGSDSRMHDLRVLGYHYRMFKADPDDGSVSVIAVSAEPPSGPVATDVHVPGGTWTLEVSPDAGWVPVWRGPILAAALLVSALIGLLLCAILVSSRLQLWLKSANEALAREKERMDVLLARQYNLISCVLQQEGSGRHQSRSMEHRTLARIEDMRREIGVSSGNAGTDELTLLELIDEGTFGKVFKGLWRGTTVAVKTMVLPARMSGAEKRERMAVMEAAISSTMNHPNIVQTFQYIIRPSSTTVACCPSSEEGGGSSSVVTAADIAGQSIGNLEAPEGNNPAVHNFEVSLVLEHCDWGSLRTALDAGAFFAEDNSLNYAAILDTAADIARAMVHLHRNQVLHSDLKVRNVLLKSDASPMGCVAKVADFGLAVRVDVMDTHVSAFQGTMSHMSPEGLLHGRVSKAGDVYSFGITLWELFTGGQAYQGIPRALVGHKVAVVGLRPTLPPFTPRDFRSLVEECWAHDAEARPSFEVVLSRLMAMRASLGSAPTPPLQRYTLRSRKLHDRRSSEQDLADAAANGLVELKSYYVNGSGTGSTAVNGADPRRGSLDGGGSGSGSGSGGLMPSGAYRLVGRTMGTGSLAPIRDTEVEEVEGGAGAAGAAGSQGKH